MLMKKLFLPIVAAALFIVAVGIFVQKSADGTLFKATPTPVPEPTVVIGQKTINVEVAKTDEEREKGLSGREGLDKDSGMLFVFDEEHNTPKFWMKGMRVALDIIWIKDGKIIKIDKKVPAPEENTPDSQLKTYSAPSSVNYVLEVNSGFCDTNSIKVGDPVTVSGI
jgi:uncharacterized membrane protein (UPF0127 family)